MIEYRDIYISFDHLVLSEKVLKLQFGNIYGIIGPSGSGKSSLLVK